MTTIRTASISGIVYAPFYFSSREWELLNKFLQQHIFCCCSLNEDPIHLIHLSILLFTVPYHEIAHSATYILLLFTWIVFDFLVLESWDDVPLDNGYLPLPKKGKVLIGSTASVIWVKPAINISIIHLKPHLDTAIRAHNVMITYMYLDVLKLEQLSCPPPPPPDISHNLSHTNVVRAGHKLVLIWEPESCDVEDWVRISF